MHAIEFVANAQDGMIKIPKEYQKQLGDEFRVIILQDALSSEVKKNRRKRTFDAVRITTKDIEFDREEANER